MKPDWKDAPEWAKWLAMDGDGWWVWYQNKPVWEEDDQEWWKDGGQCEVAGDYPDEDGEDWGFAYSTLEARP